MDESLIIQQTKNWLKTIVIDFNFCPFAKKEFIQNTIHYYIEKNDSEEQLLQNIIHQFTILDHDEELETTLIIYPHQLKSFDEYLDFLAITQELIQELQYEGIYQLASFHPQYIFEGNTPNSPSNFTNRSPYPIIHILREKSIEKARLNYPNIHEIPQKNIQFCQEKGIQFMRKLLNHCYSN